MALPIPAVTLCMIVRDAATHLPRCLASARTIADHIIVADTGSTDDSPSIAAQHGAKVIHIPWTGDFSAARNASLAPATTPWILVLDADEWLEPTHATHIATLASNTPDRAFYLDQKNTDHTGTTTRNAVVRLFPNRPDIRFTHQVHEDVVSSLVAASVPIEHTAIEIEHSGYTDPATLAAKVARNKAIIQAALAAQPDPDSEPHLRFHLACILAGGQHLDAAIAHFEWCLAHTPPSSNLSALCRLHAAECHHRANRPDRALSLLPPEPTPATHPAALMLAAQILHSGSPPAARPWLEALLDTPDRPYRPPVPLATFKTGAVAALCRTWFEAGRPEIAQRLLDLANRMKTGAVNPASTTVGTLYRGITTA